MDSASNRALADMQTYLQQRQQVVLDRKGLHALANDDAHSGARVLGGQARIVACPGAKRRSPQKARE